MKSNVFVKSKYITSILLRASMSKKQSVVDSSKFVTDDFPAQKPCCDGVISELTLRLWVICSCIIRSITLHIILVIAIGRKLLGSVREPFL